LLNAFGEGLPSNMLDVVSISSDLNAVPRGSLIPYLC
jgi:hypothetical protein